MGVFRHSMTGLAAAACSGGAGVTAEVIRQAAARCDFPDDAIPAGPSRRWGRQVISRRAPAKWLRQPCRMPGGPDAPTAETMAAARVGAGSVSAAGCLGRNVRDPRGQTKPDVARYLMRR